jgi:hypothetical protein
MHLKICTMAEILKEKGTIAESLKKLLMELKE